MFLWVAIVILVYAINPWQTMHQDICLWFAAAYSRCHWQFNTYSKMSTGRHKIASATRPLRNLTLLYEKTFLHFVLENKGYKSQKWNAGSIVLWACSSIGAAFLILGLILCQYIYRRWVQCSQVQNMWQSMGGHFGFTYPSKWLGVIAFQSPWIEFSGITSITYQTNLNISRMKWVMGML